MGVWLTLISSVRSPTDLTLCTLHPTELDSCVSEYLFEKRRTPYSVLRSQKGNAKSDNSIALAVIIVFIAWVILLVVVALLFATRPPQ